MHAHMQIYNIHLIYGWGLLFKRYRGFFAACMHNSGGILKKLRSLREYLGQSRGWKRRNVEQKLKRGLFYLGVQSLKAQMIFPKDITYFSPFRFLFFQLSCRTIPYFQPYFLYFLLQHCP